MKAAHFNTQPVKKLLRKHAAHIKPYYVNFMGIKILINPEVFNPVYTKVSGFLAKNITLQSKTSVLEMFCGSGAIGLSVVKDANKLVGIDISAKAIECAFENAKRLNVLQKCDFRQGNLWDTIKTWERFDLILANPPLLPAIPETLLERTVADSPEMKLTSEFIMGLPYHLNPRGYALMAFSNACATSVGNPMDYIQKQSMLANLKSEIQDEWDVGYEVYRIIKFTKNGGIYGKNHSNC